MTEASPPDTSYNPALYRVHVWLEWASIAVFVIGAIILVEPRVIPIFGLLTMASGVVGFRAGRTLGTFLGHFLARVHADDSEEQQLEMRRRYSRISAAWRVIIGALVVGGSAYYMLVLTR